MLQARPEVCDSSGRNRKFAVTVTRKYVTVVFPLPEVLQPCDICCRGYNATAVRYNCFKIAVHGN